MTIEMTLEELDFPTPDVTEEFEPTAAEVTAFVDWFDAETTHHTALGEWLHAEESYESHRYARLMLEYTTLSMANSERCYCSPSRGMMFDPFRYDIYNGGGGGGWGGRTASSYAAMNAELKVQITSLKEQARLTEERMMRDLTAIGIERDYAMPRLETPSRPWWQIFG